MILNPRRMTPAQRGRVFGWLWENGADGAILNAPVIVSGNVATFRELVLDSRRRPVLRDGYMIARRRRMRVRTPLRLPHVPAS